MVAKLLWAVVKETVTQPDGEICLIVERTTEIYGDPINSLGIGKDTKLLVSDAEKASSQKIFLLAVLSESQRKIHLRKKVCLP